MQPNNNQSQYNSKGFAPLYIILGIVAVAILSVLFFFVVSKKQLPSVGNQQSDSFAGQFGGGCKEKEVNFTHTPLALENIGYIFPLGRMADAHVTPTDHVYIAPINQQAEEGAYDIVSPADGEIVSVQAMPAQTVGDRSSGTRLPEDNRIIVRFSCRYYTIFIHAHELAPKVRQATGKLEPSQTKFINVPVKGGETIAKMGGQLLDWSINDTESKLFGFITPKLYESEPWKIHTIDPFSVYPEDLRNKLIALSPRSVEPAAGKIDYDKPGTAIGNWFKAGTGGFSEKAGERFWDGHLAIAPDPLDPAKITFSFGNWQGQADQFIANGDFDPASITESSGEVKVELTEPGEYIQANGENWSMDKANPVKPITLKLRPEIMGTVILQVLPGEKLKLEKFPGKTGAEVSRFTSEAQIFER